MLAKQLLPDFGGGASIWVTSMVFFQVMLLAGYGLVHGLIHRFGLRYQMACSAVMLALALTMMPLVVVDVIDIGVFEADVPGTDSAVESVHGLVPSLRLLATLLLTVALPYTLLASTGPTLQYWMANDRALGEVNPYIQYGVSNAGSLAGLLIFPFLLEPVLPGERQLLLWTAGFVIYGVLLATCMVRYLALNPATIASIGPVGQHRVLWLVQAMVPSALLIVVTHYLTQDVVNFPLLWVAPLALYLLSFICCFLFPAINRPGSIRTVAGVAGLLALVVTSRPEFGFELAVRVGSALLGLFVVSLIVHGDLEREKPERQALTGFYLMVAAGGALGSVLAGLLAPMVFVSTFEFHLAMLASLVYVIATGNGLGQTLRRSLLLVFVVFVGITYVTHETRYDGQTIARSRSFYSSYAVREADGVRRLVVGSHVHGEQFLDPARASEPLAYYHPDTGIADLFRQMQPQRVALVGLGIGSLVAYGDAATSFDVFEIDSEVIRLARSHFSVLSRSDSEIHFTVGDGRIALGDSTASYDLIVMDAFSSGTIPTHLVTLEAVVGQLARLDAEGVVAYHISNHYVDLVPVLAAAAAELDLGIAIHESGGNEALQRYPATWVALTRNEELLRRLLAAPRWKSPGSERILWRDDQSDIWSVLR